MFQSNLTILHWSLTLLQNLRDICKANTLVAVELRSELSKARSEHANQLTDQQIKHRDDVMRERKKHAASNETLKKSLKMIQEELVETTNMSLDFADEYSQLRNTKNAELRKQTQKAEQMENLSKSRNEKLKKAKDNVQELRSSIDSITSTYDEQLAKAHSEIASLMDKLVDSEIEVESLQKDLAKAKEELLVSFMCHLIFCKLPTNIFVTTETKTSCYTEEEGSVGRSSDAIGGWTSFSQNTTPLYLC